VQKGRARTGGMAPVVEPYHARAGLISNAKTGEKDQEEKGRDPTEIEHACVQLYNKHVNMYSII
jgi:hypothetical protein